MGGEALTKGERKWNDLIYVCSTMPSLFLALYRCNAACALGLVHMMSTEVMMEGFPKNQMKLRLNSDMGMVLKVSETFAAVICA